MPDPSPASPRDPRRPDSAATRPDTREALLDAAEALFSERGIAATSLRAVTARASANLAAVSYHFGGKEGLVHAVFDRRLRPVNQERLRLLEEARQRAAPDPPAPEAVLRAFIEPVVRVGGGRSSQVMRFRRLMGRTFAEPGDEMRKRLKGQFQEVGERFLAALGRCFPHLPPTALLWRFHFMIGCTVHAILHGELIAEHSGGLCDPRQSEELTDRLVEFVLAGFRSGAAAGPAPGPGEGEAKVGEAREGAAQKRPSGSVFAWEEGF